MVIKNRFKEAQANRTLDSFEKDKLKKARKMTKTFIKIYNGLCPQCRAKVIRTPRMPFMNYCKVCQQMIKDNGGEE